MTPEQKTRVSIDALVIAAGWHVCNVADANIHASTGVAIREFPLSTGFWVCRLSAVCQRQSLRCHGGQVTRQECGADAERRDEFPQVICFYFVGCLRTFHDG